MKFLTWNFRGGNFSKRRHVNAIRKGEFPQFGGAGLRLKRTTSHRLKISGEEGGNYTMHRCGTRSVKLEENRELWAPVFSRKRMTHEEEGGGDVTRFSRVN